MFRERQLLPTYGVNAIEVTEGTIYVGGRFVSLGGLPRRNLGAVDASGRVRDFAPFSDGPESLLEVRALANHGRSLFVGGTGDPVVSAFDLASGARLPWQPTIESSARESRVINALAVHSDRVYIAGRFTQVNGQSRGSLAAVDVVTGALEPFRPSTPRRLRSLVDLGRMFALTTYEDTLYVGGDMTGFGSVDASGFAQFDTP